MSASGAGWTMRVMRHGSAEPREVELRAGLTIGRHPDNECIVDDEHVGRFQLCVVEEGGALFFEELGSSNPTRALGRALAKGERLRAAPGLRLALGRSTIEVVAPAGADDPELTVAPSAGSEVDFERTIAPAASPAEDPERTIAPGASVESSGGATPAGVPADARRAPLDDEHTLPSPIEPAEPELRARSRAPAAPPERSVSTAPNPPTTDVPPAAAPLPAVKPGSAAEIEDFGGRTLALGSRGAADAAAALAFLETRRARLVLAGEVDRRSEPIRSAEFVIGREVGDCRLAHPAVSARHARIAANVELGTFQIEDFGSGNRTYLNGAALAPGAAQALATESHLRFGPIDALFVVELDAESQRVPPAVFARTLELLVVQGSIRSEQAAQARSAAAAGQHPGEALILSGALKVSAWRTAFESARLAAIVSPTASPRRRAVLMLAAAAIAIAVALWLLLG